MWLLTVWKDRSVEGMEKKINKLLRRWLGVPPNFTFVGLYIKLGWLQLPLSSVEEEFKVAKCRVATIYRGSPDSQVRNAGVTTRAGRKWAADTFVTQGESVLKP